MKKKAPPFKPAPHLGGLSLWVQDSSPRQYFPPLFLEELPLPWLQPRVWLLFPCSSQPQGVQQGAKSAGTQAAGVFVSQGREEGQLSHLQDVCQIGCYS